jgi:multidrug resistance efflux pump
MFRRIRPVLVVVAVLLVVGTLLGARYLSPGSGGGGDAQPKSALPPSNKSASGPVVIGFVDTDPQPATYGLPPHMASGKVEKVFVTEGQEVKAGDPLFAFDSSGPRAKLATATANLEMVKVEVLRANEAVAQHAKKVDHQKQLVDVARRRVELAQAAYANAVFNYREAYAKQFGEKIEARIETDTDLFKLRASHHLAVLEHDVAKSALTEIESAKVEIAVTGAAAAVKVAEAAVAEANLAVELCTVKASVAGTVEQIHVAAGTTLGVSTRGTAVSLIPSGPRIVRAEIEADFAHRVGSDKKGKEVTITDHTDGKLVYKGVVEHIGGAFLKKRHGGDGLLTNETLVLEARVVVTDPNPTGKSPLRVGQKVRVNFGP